jgi:hypothetical protein
MTAPANGRTWQPDPLLTPDEAAAWIGKPTATLYAWRSRSQAPVRSGLPPR